MLEIIIDTLLDGLKILPFLWLAFLLIELLEHKLNQKTKTIIEKSGRLGPLLGSILGCFPQCGFSVMATNLYITKMITMGTLISIYLSTSDEMLPLLISHGSSLTLILKIIAIKVGIGMLSGFLIDCFIPRKKITSPHQFCEEEHCHCETGILKSSLIHTIHTITFILFITFILNIIMNYGGITLIKNLAKQNHFISSLIASLIGLIPNCAASVILTELYLSNVISFANLIAGLLTGSGVAILVLLKSNKSRKENLQIILFLYLIGSISGILLECLSRI